MGENSLIIEIRMGAGGEEAALFAADLFKMYKKYADLKGFKVAVLDSHLTELGGFKQITFQIQGKEVLSKMQYEAGVHRVQRIPKTEKGSRVHTSTVSVAVLPQPEPTEININPKDLRIDFYRASGHGGQNVNKRQTAVRIVHVPTGLMATAQVGRQQEENRKFAMAILKARIFEQKQREAESAIKDQRKDQIGRAQRAEKIRTYNFPQDRLTDHRIKKSWHNIERIMSGNLDPIIEKIQISFN